MLRFPNFPKCLDLLMYYSRQVLNHTCCRLRGTHVGNAQLAKKSPVAGIVDVSFTSGIKSHMFLPERHSCQDSLCAMLLWPFFMHVGNVEFPEFSKMV